LNPDYGNLKNRPRGSVFRLAEHIGLVPNPENLDSCDTKYDSAHWAYRSGTFNGL